MDARSLASHRRQKVWLSRDSGSFETFRQQVARTTNPADWPFANEIVANVPVYDGAKVRAVDDDADARRELMAEWVEIFDSGPGIIVIRGAIGDRAAIDRATQIFDAIITEQHRTGSGGGDHFAKPGANDRIWNSLEKHCLADPANFISYYSSSPIALACEAWLGAGYQMTAQVNRVNPGGAAQTAHRDYHLGFMNSAQMEAYPGHIHRVSPLLTLQGAVAHCDMPLESGPTMFLPYSQAFFEGYLAFGRPEFQRHFSQHHVQLPMTKGDAVFFSPALMHGAGTNRSSDIYRMANLLQVSSAFGRAMEGVNRVRMSIALYPALLSALAAGSISRKQARYAIASAAEGYAFPTNLDRDPPIGGLAPRTQAEIMCEALDAGMPAAEFGERLQLQAARREA